MSATTGTSVSRRTCRVTRPVTTGLPQQKPVVELASLALGFILARRLIALGQLDLNDYQ